jgi:glycosyltransferase involved in cell wall biosynthesis
VSIPDSRAPLRLLHVITDLDTGGAEVMLARLLEKTDRDAFTHGVLSLTTVGPVGDAIRALGVPVAAVGLTRLPRPAALAALIARVRTTRPHVIQTWLPHANLLGGLAGRLVRSTGVIWSIHQGNPDPSRHPLSEYAARATARLSAWVPDRIVCCAEVSRRVHIARGYRESKIVLIPNGFDLDVFRPDSAARHGVRAELGIAGDALLVGHMTRFHPHKDIVTFLRAAARVPGVQVMICGEGMHADNPALAALIQETALAGRVHLLGRRVDVPRIYAALDVYCSSSYTEAFPLVVGEAMASGVPCVVTDAGDSALMVGDTGRVVPPRDPLALAAALDALLALGVDERARLGRAARAHIARHYALGEVTQRYQRLYCEVAAEHSAR